MRKTRAHGLWTGSGAQARYQVCASASPFSVLFRLLTLFSPAGSVKVSLLRYLKDARSIPVTGEEMEGVEALPDSSVFSVRDGTVYYANSALGNTGVSLGSHIRYVVQAS